MEVAEAHLRGRFQIDFNFLRNRGLLYNLMYPIYFQHTYQTLPELENRQWSQRDNIAPAAKRGSNIVARKTVPCEICQKLFFSNFGLRAHKRDLHGIIEDSASNKDCDGGDREASFFSCDSCNKRFKTMNALQSHERDAHRIFDGGDNYEKGISESIQMLPCDLCNRLFKTNFGLLAHRRDSHHEKLQNSIPGDENNTAFPCSICRRVLKTSIGLLAHQRDAHDMEPLPQYCVEGGGGGEATGDEIVKDSVKQTKIFNCAYCRKAFRTFLDLRAHERDAHGLVNEASPQLNTPSKMIPCTICQKVFWTIFGLYTHQRDAHSIAPREISVIGKLRLMSE